MAAVLSLGMAPAAFAQEADEERIAVVRSALQELSRFEADGDVLAIYDRMLPDARNLFPRGALAAWFASGETPLAAGEAEDVEVAFEEDWTSELTGEAYDEAALVTFRQEATLDGETAERDRELTFVNDGARWRWVPDIAQDRIDELAGALEDDVSYESAFDDDFYGDLDTFWAGIFEREGVDYEPPADVVEVRDEPLDTGCGVERDIDAAGIYYCRIDETIYFSPEFEELVVRAVGDYGWNHIIAHEWGHHIQDLLGINVSRDPELDDGYYVIEIEQMADCFAGIYAQDALASGEIRRSDVRDAETITEESGDLADVAWDDITAHGTGEQRVQAMLTGFEDGFLGCNLDVGDVASG
jgi:predicted metalloprotease